MFLGSVSTVCAPRWGGDFRAARHSHWAPGGAADAVRMGLQGQAHQRPDEKAFHGLSATAHGSENDQASARKTQSGRTAAGSAHALRLALRHETHRYEYAATSVNACDGPRLRWTTPCHVLPYRVRCESTVSNQRRWACDTRDAIRRRVFRCCRSSPSSVMQGSWVYRKLKFLVHRFLWDPLALPAWWKASFRYTPAGSIRHRAARHSEPGFSSSGNLTHHADTEALTSIASSVQRSHGKPCTYSVGSA
jgi:hypothetical protein